VAHVSHQVLSRKYRPQGFDELVGQEHVARILRNALKTGRVGHAYLLVGPRGVGKTTTARILAKAINCARAGRAGGLGAPAASAGDPCGECPSCLGITAGSDLDVVEIDAASNNAVDDVRALREQVGYAPVRSPFRIWIVDEVHMLSTAAFNAFLKTLEEPPPHVKFIFCTTEEHRLPTTFRSRCQVVEFRPIAPAAMSERLAALAQREGAEVDREVLERVAAGALGGLRDAESLLEQLLAAREGSRVTVADYDALSGRAPEELLRALLAAVHAGDAAGALAALDACLLGAAKPGVLADQWLEAQRQELVAAAKGGDGGALARASRALDVLLGKRAHLRAGADGTLVLEAAAVELARLPQARDLDRLIEALKARGPATPAPVSPAPRPDARGPVPAAGPRSAAPPGGPAPRALAVVPGPAAALPRFAPVAAAVAPPVAPAAADAGPTLDLVRERWDAFAEVAGRRDVRLRDALRRATLTGVADGRMRLALQRSDAMARATLERPEMVRAFRQAAREVLGAELAPAVETLADGAAGPRVDATLREHPDVRRVAEATGGRVLSVEREAGERPATA
jgi:DNA polymerase III subunit gamma/tau